MNTPANSEVEPVDITPVCRHFCNKSRAMQILKMSDATFKKLGLLPVETVKDPYGYGGKEYRYNMKEIQTLANNPAEVARRLQVVKTKKTRPLEQATESGLIAEGDWDNFG